MNQKRKQGEVGMWPQSMDRVAWALVERLVSRRERIALAESCTCGMAAAIIGGVPGASNVFCGSMVTYRIASKRAWLGVPGEIIDIHSAESPQTTEAMAMHLLDACPEADWTAAVTGHLGPGAPADQDGEVFFCLIRREAQEGAEPSHLRCALNATQRIPRQIEAATRLIDWVSERVS